MTIFCSCAEGFSVSWLAINKIRSNFSTNLNISYYTFYLPYSKSKNFRYYKFEIKCTECFNSDQHICSVRWKQKRPDAASGFSAAGRDRFLQNGLLYTKYLRYHRGFCGTPLYGENSYSDKVGWQQREHCWKLIHTGWAPVNWQIAWPVSGLIPKKKKVFTLIRLQALYPTPGIFHMQHL